MTTCFYGGTFNPIHWGHVRLALHAKETLCPDKMLLIPSFIPPHKQADSLVSAVDRLAMAELAAKRIGCEVSDIELRRNDVSYSVYTLEQLKQEGYGNLYFLMGSDMFLCLEKWYEFRRVLSLCTPVTAPRREQELPGLMEHAAHLKECYQADSLVCDFQVTDISSTELRCKIREREDVNEFIPEDILEYIQTRGLYQRKG